jgi:hypothetical protein
MLLTAVRKGWDIDDDTRLLAVKVARRIAMDKNAKNRDRLAASKLIKEFDLANISKLEAVMKTIAFENDAPPADDAPTVTNNFNVQINGAVTAEAILELADAEGLGDTVRELAKQHGIENAALFGEAETPMPDDDDLHP